MPALQTVLIQKSTGMIIKHGLYPRTDMQPIEGLDPDLEYLVKVTPYISPEYDPRYFLLVVINAVTEEQHPEFPHLKLYKTTYTLEKRANEEIEFHAKQAQKQADNQLCNTEDQMGFTLKVQSALDRLQSGLDLTANESDTINTSRGLTLKLDKNQDNLNLILGLINEGLEPNLDEGWERF